MIKINWLIYHEPVDLFVRTAKAFAEKIADLTDNRIQIDFFTSTEFNERSPEFFKRVIDPLTLFKSGEVQMGQFTSGQLGKWQAIDFFALDMPFLFDSHEHCARVLEGTVGENLLSYLEKNTPVKGLAFTYSGGYRLIAADKEIKTAEDLKGMSLVTGSNPVFADTAEAFGCEVISINVRDFSEEAKQARLGNSVQTTLPRYKRDASPEVHKYVTNTKHSMFLTSIVIATDFWNQLSQEDQQAIKTAAMYSSRLERQWTLEESEKISKNQTECEKLGIMSYKEFSNEESQKLKEATKTVYSRYKPLFSEGLIDNILQG